MANFYDQNGNLSYSITLVNGVIASRTDYSAPGAAAWSTFETDYNSAGLITQEKVVYPDGHYDITQFDTTGAQSWSSILATYNASGVKTSDWTYGRNGTDIYHGYFTAGSEPWTDIVDVFVSSGNMSTESIYYPDRSYTINSYDLTKTYWYTSYIEHFTPQGQNDSTLYQIRGGGSIGYSYDVSGTQPYIYYYNSYDSLGRFVNKMIMDRDGSETIVTSDHDDTQSWASIIRNYTPSGAVSSVEQTQHDGTYSIIQYDTVNAQSWTSDQKSFTSDGQLSGETISYRSGQVVFTPYTTKPVVNPINTYDANGKVLSTSVMNTDGTKQTTSFCYDGSEPWVKDVANTSATGALSKDSTYFADGSSEVTTYSPSSGVAYASAYYDTLGRFENQWTVAPDGSKQYYDKDQVGNQSFSDFTDLYNAAGLFYDEIKNYRDGTFTDYQINQQYSSSNSNLNWTTKLTTHAQGGAIESVKTTFADQTSTYTSYDYSNIEAWASITDNRNSYGLVVSRDTIYHDGSSSVLIMDVASTYSWSSHALGYTAAGVLTYDSYQYDDGTVSTTYYDAPGGSERSRVTHYNVAGQVVDVQVQNTDGSGYDVATQYVSASDSLVVSTDVTQSNGSVVYTLYDPAAATTFTSRVDSYVGYHLVSEVTNNRDLSVIVETFDPTSIQTWSDIKKIYAPSGALTEEIDKYHSGMSTDTHYDATGQVIDVLAENADGTGYEVKTQYVSASDSRVVSTDLIQSNGSVVYTLYDPTAATTFTSRVDSYTGYHLVSEVTNNRDLSVIVETFDPTSHQAWSDIKQTFAPSGALAEELDKYHDGTSTDTHYDVNNSQVWSSTFVAYDNQGRQVSTLETFHNGTSQLEVFNPTGTAGYQDYIDTKTATGAVQTHEVDYADGSRAMVQYDVANTQVWASETFGYDNQGRTTYEDIVNHNGTSSVTTYDVAMTSSELYHTYSYNAAGQQTFLHVVYTNGTTYDHSFM